MGFSSLQHLQSLIAKMTAMLFEPFLNGLGNNLHHTEPVECTKLCWTHTKKPGEPGFSSIQWVCLVKRADICCLLPFRATRDVEGNLLVFCECLEVLSLNSGE